MKGTLMLLLGGLCASCAPTRPPGGTPRVKRVVLVHGFGENGSSFSWMKERLQRLGMECYVPKLRPADGRGGLARLAEGLKRDIDRHFGEHERIAVVSFSMGGIVSRYYLQELGGAGRCDTLVTIASPHHGTLAARLYPTRGAAEMRPGSEFLAKLDASADRLGDMPVVSYRTRMDLVIIPASSSIWARAVNLEYPAPLHPLLLSSRGLIDDLERRLMTAEPAPAP
jgi:triacylglycerol lipase